MLICEVAISAWFSFKMLFIWFVLWIGCGGNHNWETNDLARSVSTHERHERHGGRHGIDDLHVGRHGIDDLHDIDNEDLHGIDNEDLHGGRHDIDNEDLHGIDNEDLHSGRQARHSAILVSKGYSKKKLAIRF